MVRFKPLVLRRDKFDGLTKADPGGTDGDMGGLNPVSTGKEALERLRPN